MKLINTNQELLKKLFKNDKSLLYVSLIPYKNNTCIKVYDEDGNPLGDIPEDFISSYVSKNQEILFIKEYIDDDTGLPMYELETMI